MSLIVNSVYIHVFLNISAIAGSEITIESGASSRIEEKTEENLDHKPNLKEPPLIPISQEKTTTIPELPDIEGNTTQTIHAITTTTHMDTSLDESSNNSGTLCKSTLTHPF